jgi:non-homologous end joining protein Ku
LATCSENRRSPDEAADSNQGFSDHQQCAEQKPIKYLKGIETKDGFEEVPEEEIIKGYEHTKGHYVLIELEALKLEAKHTIDMATYC